MLIVYLAFHLSSYILSRDSPRPVQVWQAFEQYCSLASLLAISFPCTPEYLGSQNSPTLCQVEMSFNAFWHWCTNGDIILAAWRAFRATWLSKQIQMYFSDLAFIWISWAQAKIAYISAWETVAHFPRKMLSLLPTHCSQTPALIPLFPEPICTRQGL